MVRGIKTNILCRLSCSSEQNCPKRLKRNTDTVFSLARFKKYWILELYEGLEKCRAFLGPWKCEFRPNCTELNIYCIHGLLPFVMPQGAMAVVSLHANLYESARVRCGIY